MTITILVNRSGGAASAAGDALVPDIEAAFAAAGAQAQVRMLEGCDMAAAVEQACGRAERLVVAGGDGTLSCAAGVLAGRDDAPALAILPLGTLNHLARDLAIPAELNEAAALAVTGQARAIDVARVNDRLFVNNASIGLYPMMVRSRDASRLPKWLATLPAAGEALRRLPHHRLRLRLDQAEQAIVTPLLFVGNNDYSLEAGSLGQRSSLCDGRLSVFAVPRSSRLGLLAFAARVLMGRANRGQDFETLGAVRTLDVDAHGDSIHIALDGEVARLAFPLRFAIERAALRVIAPAV